MNITLTYFFACIGISSYLQPPYIIIIAFLPIGRKALKVK